jgi:hypothetical protein
VAVNDWHANFIRLPVNEDFWFGYDPNANDGGAAYRAFIDNVIATASNEGVYINLDLHWSDEGVYGQNNGQHDLPDDHSTLFWQDAAARYANNPAVLFDLYNEPTQTTWQQWLNGGMIDENGVTYHSPGMQGILDTIRATGATNVVVPEGEDYGDDLSGITNGFALTDSAHNIMYQAHLYPGAAETDAQRDAIVSAVAAISPLYVGEWGPDPRANPVTGVPEPSPAGWTQNMLAWLDAHSYSWTAWSMNPETYPILISDFTNYTPTDYFGAYVKANLTAHANGGGGGGPTALSVSNSAAPEFRAVGTVIGAFSSTEAGNHTFTYSLVSGAGSTDNASFAVQGNQLVSAVVFDASAQTSYSIRVRTTDEGGQSFDQTFTISVANNPALSRSGSVLTVTGTAGNDVFAFTGGATNIFNLNGVGYVAPSSTASTVVFVGGGGSDSAYFAGNGPVSVILTPTADVLTGNGFTLRLFNVAQAIAYGGPGETAYLYDSPGKDVFAGLPTYSVLTGAGFSEYAVGFGTVVAQSTAGGADAAYLYDAAGQNAFVGTPSYGELIGAGFLYYAVGFSTVLAQSAAGSHDTAYLYDAVGQNVFVGTPTYTYFQGAGYVNEAVGFQTVLAYAAAGGTDVAYLGDGPGSNTFVGNSAYSYLSGTGYFNVAIGFRQANAYASGAGTDAAYLSDTPGNDVFYGQGNSGALVAASGVEYGAVGFGQVTIVSNQGGFDQAFLSSLLFMLTEVGPWH